MAGLRTADDMPHFHARLAHQLWLTGETEHATTTMELAVRMAERAGAPEVLALVRMHQARLARYEGRVGDAGNLVEAALNLAVDLTGPPQFQAMLLGERGSVHVAAGELEAARRVLDDAIGTAVASKDCPFIAVVVSAHAGLAWAEGHAAQAAKLLGAAEGIRGCKDLSLPDVVALTEEVSAELGNGFEACYTRGLALDSQGLLGYLGLTPPP
jgi:hypothetical protein